MAKGNANQSSRLRVLSPGHQSLYNYYCKSKALQSPAYNHLKLKTQLNYLKCFLKAKKYSWADAALQVAEERGMFSLVLLQREVLLSAFGAGREKEGLGKSEGERELPSA